MPKVAPLLPPDTTNAAVAGFTPEKAANAAVRDNDSNIKGKNSFFIIITFLSFRIFRG